MPSCRFCGTTLGHTFVDLGKSPLCESYVSSEQSNQMEPFYPLHVYVCGECFLVQLEGYVSPKDIFSEYAYFSCYADSWVEHCPALHRENGRAFQLSSWLAASGRWAGRQQRRLSAPAFRETKVIPVLGIEPAQRCGKGVPTIVKFFGEGHRPRPWLLEGQKADLLIGRNVLAQVPDLNDFRLEAPAVTSGISP